MSEIEPRDFNPFTIAALRAEMGLSLEEFGLRIGLASKGNVSILERGGPCSLAVALSVEELSKGRIDAAGLNADVARARRGVLASVQQALNATEPA